MPALDPRRAILMSAMNRHYLKLWSVENRNYTVEQWTPSKDLPLNVLGGGLEKLYFNKDGIKRSGVAQVCKFFRGKHVNVPPLRTELCPMKPCANHARLHHALDSGPQKDIAPPVEDAHPVALRDSPRPRIAGVHFEQADFLHLLDRGQIR